MMVDASLNTGIQNDMAESKQAVTLQDKYRALVRLTRWREHVPYTVPLVIIGALLATTQTNAPIGWELLAVVVANILAMSFAFMINDVEDAPDDALNPKKRAHNVISSGLLTRRQGLIATWLTFFVALGLYAFVGGWTLLWGFATLALCYFYSAHPFRLKARPITDVVSHILMLSALLIMTGYFTYDSAPGIAWFVIISVTLVSAYGQFYNQIDDYEVDKEAGLKNTVVLLGKTPTMFLMYLSLLGAVISMGIAIFGGAFPEWLGTVALVAVIVSALFPWEHDMRGNLAEGSGNIQRPSLVVANMVALLWLTQAIGMLTIA
jgi:4-hydroxybenzoate polyprenyltransferase